MVLPSLSSIKNRFSPTKTDAVPVGQEESPFPSGMPPSLKNKTRFALDLATHNRDSDVNHALAPGCIGPMLKSLTMLSTKPGTLSAQLSSLYPTENPLTQLANRTENVIKNTGGKYKNLSAAILHDDIKPDVMREYDKRKEDVMFGDYSEEGVEKVNNAITENTCGLIPGNIDFNTIEFPGYLANTLYLNAKWKYPFDKNDTMPRNFRSTDGKMRQVPTMYKEFSGYQLPEVMKKDDLQAVKLPYKNANGSADKLSLLLVMKTDDTLTQPTAENIEQIMDDLKKPYLENHERVVTLPKLEIKSILSIKKMIKALNLEGCLAQDPKKIHVGIDEIIQNCVLKIDEEGTEAAAVTVCYALGIPKPPPPQCHFEFNKPFTAAVLLESKDPALKNDTEILFHAHVNHLDDDSLA